MDSASCFWKYIPISCAQCNEAVESAIVKNVEGCWKAGVQREFGMSPELVNAEHIPNGKSQFTHGFQYPSNRRCYLILLPERLKSYLSQWYVLPRAAILGILGETADH